MRELNTMQKEAVNAGNGHFLVLAGAGSGKTTVLTERVSRLLRCGMAKPAEILSITFTNKAAQEMKTRISRQAGGDLKDMWTCTFHSLCVRILRMFPGTAGFTSSFSIYDSDDSKRIIRDILKDLKINREREKKEQISAGAVRSVISSYKNSRHADARDAGENSGMRTLAEFYDQEDVKSFGEYAAYKIGGISKSVLDNIYAEYMSRLKKENAMDFDDLLLNARRVLRENAKARRTFQKRFRYILIDEYQDTNPVQYEIVCILAALHGNLFCVGDDDQSIYGFRGTDISIIRGFTGRFPDAKIIRLEENYRSTASILNVANSVIENNTERLGKTLWTAGAQGNLPLIYYADNAFDESCKICSEIMHRHDDCGERYSANAVLYRTHAISRIVEECLIARNIPYRIYGGLGFYQRREIKDMTAFLTVMVNPRADQQLMRIINVPRRGVGEKTLGSLRKEAESRSVPLWDVVKDPGSAVSAAMRRKLGDFAHVLECIAEDADRRPAYETVQRVYEETGYRELLEQEDEDKENTRKENVLELIRAASNFEVEDGGFAAFMQHLSLMTDQDQARRNEDAVSLMTVHAAKGLEYDNVYVAGMEEDIFPSVYAADDGSMEEERRLFYVAVTRAKRNLMLLCSLERSFAGRWSDLEPSRFLEEIPPEQAEVIFS